MPSAPGIRQSMIATSYSYQRELVDRVVAPLDGVDVVAALAQPERDEVPQPGVVFGYEDPHRLLSAMGLSVGTVPPIVDP